MVHISYKTCDVETETMTQQQAIIFFQEVVSSYTYCTGRLMRSYDLGQLETGIFAFLSFVDENSPSYDDQRKGVHKQNE